MKPSFVISTKNANGVAVLKQITLNSQNGCQNLNNTNSVSQNLVQPVYFQNPRIVDRSGTQLVQRQNSAQIEVGNRGVINTGVQSDLPQSATKLVRLVRGNDGKLFFSQVPILTNLTQESQIQNVSRQSPTPSNSVPGTVNHAISNTTLVLNGATKIRILPNSLAQKIISPSDANTPVPNSVSTSPNQVTPQDQVTPAPTVTETCKLLPPQPTPQQKPETSEPFKDLFLPKSSNMVPVSRPHGQRQPLKVLQKSNVNLSKTTLRTTCVSSSFPDGKSSTFEPTSKEAPASHAAAAAATTFPLKRKSMEIEGDRKEDPLTDLVDSSKKRKTENVDKLQTAEDDLNLKNLTPGDFNSLFDELSEILDPYIH